MSLSPSSMGDSDLSLVWLQNLGALKSLVLLGGATGLIFLGHKQLLLPWKAIPQQGLRIVILTAAGVLSWIYSTYDFNLFLNQAQYFDRLLLLLWFGLSCWCPLFLLFLLPQVILILQQFPILPGFSWAIPILPVRILMLFVSAFLIYIFTKRWLSAGSFILIGTLVAAHYWYPGIGKANWPWLSENELSHLLPLSYANAWLAHLDMDTISKLTNVFATFNIPLKLFILAAELGALLFFTNRRISKYLLLAWCMMHIGIFLITGICFWVWMILDLTILYALLKADWWSSIREHPAHTVGWCSVLLILSSPFWAKPVQLAWFDAPVAYTYEYEAVTAAGDTLLLPQHFFAPYDYQFTINSMSYLSEQPLFNVYQEVDQVRVLNAANNVEEVGELEYQMGSIQYNADKQQRMQFFLQTFLGNWNMRQSRRTLLSYVSAPRFLWGRPDLEIEKISALRIYQVLHFYTKSSLRTVRRTEVLAVYPAAGTK